MREDCHDGLVKVTLLYFDGCLRAALDGTGTPDVEVTYRKVSTPREAESVAFRGSPTILIDGRDPSSIERLPSGCPAGSTAPGPG